MTRSQTHSPWLAGQYDNPMPELTVSIPVRDYELFYCPELEFLKSLWGLRTEEEYGYLTGPQGYVNQSWNF